MNTSDFVKGLLAAISGAFTASAGIPLFLPCAGYLLGAGAILKLGEGVADALYESQPAFQSTGTIEFSDEGEDPTVAGWRILCNSGLAATDYAFKAGTGLVDRSGRTYDGDEPYIVLSLDGRQDKDLEGFTPHAATAGVLQKFFGMKDGAQTVADTLVQAMALPFDDRVALWREHLATFLEPASGLADDQRRFIADVIDHLEVLLACGQRLGTRARSRGTSYGSH